MSDELKACWSCGLRDVECAKVEFRGGPTSYYVFCNSCLTRSDYYDTESEAISAWNRRVVTREQVIAAARALHAEDANDGLLVLPFDEEADDSFHRRAAIAAFRAAGFEVADG